LQVDVVGGCIKVSLEVKFVGVRKVLTQLSICNLSKFSPQWFKEAWSDYICINVTYVGNK